MLYNNIWRIYGTLIVSVDFLLLCCSVFFCFRFVRFGFVSVRQNELFHVAFLAALLPWWCLFLVCMISDSHTLLMRLFFSLSIFVFFSVFSHSRTNFFSLCRHNTSSSKQYLTECAMARNIIFFFSIEIFGLDWANLFGLNWFLCYILCWYFMLFLEKFNRKSFRKCDFLFSFFFLYLWIVNEQKFIVTPIKLLNYMYCIWRFSVFYLFFSSFFFIRLKRKKTCSVITTSMSITKKTHTKYNNDFIYFVGRLRIKQFI